MQFMIIGSIKLVRKVVHKYQRQYGPTNVTNVIKDITQNHNAIPKKLDINEIIIPSKIRHKGA
jgi:hypothetical protein